MNVKIGIVGASFAKAAYLPALKHIEGVEVTAGNSEQITTTSSNITTNTNNINNLGSGIAGSTALTVALKALPKVSKDSDFSCGIGSDAYGS